MRGLDPVRQHPLVGRPKAASAQRPGRSLQNGLSWPLVAAVIAPIWSLAYGLLALSWALGATGYPFSEAVDPDARLSLLGSLTPQVGIAGLATVSLLGTSWAP